MVNRDHLIYTKLNTKARFSHGVIRKKEKIKKIKLFWIYRTDHLEFELTREKIKCSRMYRIGGKRFYSALHSGAASFSTTKIFFDISVDNQPAGRIIFKVIYPRYGILEFGIFWVGTRMILSVMTNKCSNIPYPKIRLLLCLILQLKTIKAHENKEVKTKTFAWTINRVGKFF